MAQFSMGIRVVSRGKKQSIMAAVAYRAGERIWDERLGVFHDFRHKQGGVEHKELLFPVDAPPWTKGIDREAFWNAVDANEKRKDAQTARDLRIMIPREVPPSERVALVRDYLRRNFVERGMVVDACFHNTTASDASEQPHVHCLITQRPLVEGGFGQKVRHDMVASDRMYPDGRPVLVESNPDSWNSTAYFERCREDWEHTANTALERAGSDARVDRRSYLERGLSKLPEPALRLAMHLKELRGVMQERWGQFQYARFYGAVEGRAKEAFGRLEEGPAVTEAVRTFQRFHDWIDRQLDRLAPAREAPARDLPSSSPDLER